MSTTLIANPTSIRPALANYLASASNVADAIETARSAARKMGNQSDAMQIIELQREAARIQYHVELCERAMNEVYESIQRWLASEGMDDVVL